MTDYIVTIGTKYDSTGMTQFAVDQKKADDATKKTTNDVNQQNESIRKNGKAAQDAANQLNKYGMSQKAYNAALRGVPAQITDIVVSLQGGQRPLTVLLQQGGQLKDMFGGIRPAVEALASSTAKLINPWTAAAAAAVALGVAYMSARREMEAINQTLALTGRQAGVSAGDIIAMADQFDRLKGVTKGSATEMINAVVATRQFSGEGVKAVSELALAMQKLSGGETEDLIKQLTALGKDPVKAVLELNEQFLVLTDTQFKEIRAARDSGDQKKATLLAAQALTAGVNALSAELRENENWFDRSTAAAKNWAAEVWDAIKNIGRDLPEQKKLADSILGMQGALIKLNEAQADTSFYSAQRVKQAKAEVDMWQRQIEQSSSIINSRKQEAAAQTAAAQAAQLFNAATEKNFDLTATKGAKASRAIEEVRKRYAQLIKDAGSNAEAVKQLEGAQLLEIANINKQYEEKKKKSRDTSLERDLRRQNKYFADLKTLYEQSQADLDNVGAERSIRAGELTNESANRLIAIINAESKAYEQAGFIMRGYTSIAEGVSQANITMTQSKALELGIIKKSSDEIDTNNKKYQQAVIAAREYANSQSELAKAMEAANQASFVKDTTSDIMLQNLALQATDNMTRGLVEGSREWNMAMAQVNLHATAVKLALQGMSEENVNKITESMFKLNEQIQKSDDLKRLANNIENTLGGAFDAVWQNGLDGLKQWIIDAARELAKAQIIKGIMNLWGAYSGNAMSTQAAGSINSFGSNLDNFRSFQANGGAWNGGVQMFANGGVVNRATAFGMAGGNLGVMGEAGPEAIMPLKRGPDGKLGVSGGGGSSVNNNTAINTSITINSSGDNAADQAALAKAVDQMVVIKVKQVLEDQQRTGNSLGAVRKQRGF